MGLPTLLTMCALLGAGSFAAGSIPLSFTLSKSHLSKLSALGTGLLLGAALGVIIPEGIETLSSSYSDGLPTSKIALCLLCGFTFMLVLEQVISPHTHSHHQHALPMHSRPSLNLHLPTTNVDFDADLDEIEREVLAEQNKAHQRQYHARNASTSSLHSITFVPPALDGNSDPVASKTAVFPLTLGLVMHALADGLALGVSALASSSATSAKEGTQLSLVVFLALFVHKAPTALALTTSLLAASLPRTDSRKHLLVFSLSTPLGAMVTYAVFSILGNGKNDSHMDELAGFALLVSGGTFLYVATVLQPVSHSGGSSSSDSGVEDSNKVRVLFVVLGIFLPFFIGGVLGHGHSGHS